ncbi:MAG: exonuclease domain-containing protein [Candidatus Binatia bacterium]
MRDKLHDYLLERPAGASPRELLDLVFTQPGADPEFGPRFLHALLAPDPRFGWRAEDGTWYARLHGALARRLYDTTFVVVDLETTGGAASPANIIEIGAARIHRGRVVEEFQQLVNPGSRLPTFITQLTGIDDTMLRDQPPITAVWPRFVEFLGDGVLVAHNAAFDISFLNAAAVAHSGRPLPHPHLCTLRLTRRLIPELRRRSLDVVASHFGIPISDRHRALGDVRITVEIFFHMIERLAARGIEQLHQVLDLQHHARDGRRFVCPLPREKVVQLPPQPGIYQFFGADGRLLYVGKAKNLRERVGSYLSNAAGHSNKTLDLIRHSCDVRVQVAGSELEAALAEAEAIRQHKPPYNRLGKHLPRIAFLKLSVGDEYPRLSITEKLGTGKARYVGPFRSREQAGELLGLLTRRFRLRTCAGRLRPTTSVAPCFQGQVSACTAPCAARVSTEAYREQVSGCLALFDGGMQPTENDLRQRRDEHAAALRFEAAARVQRDLDLLEMLVRRQRTLGWIVGQQNFLVLQPGADWRSVLTYVVLGGRLAIRRRLYDGAEMDALAHEIREQFTTYQGTPIKRDEVDGTQILAAWLRQRGETDGYVFQIDAAAAPATQKAEWRAACADLLNTAGLSPESVGVSSSEPPRPESSRQDRKHPRAAGVGPLAD